MKEGERQILITEKAPVIRDALSALLAEIKSEDHFAPSTLETLEGFSRQGCNKLILDLRRTKESFDGIPPGISNLRASQLGPVLVVSSEVNSFELMHEIEAIRHAHSFPRHLTASLLAFVHMLFSLPWRGHWTASARVR